MKKEIVITPQAKRYLDGLPETVQAETGRLEFPDARMLQRGLFEIRVAAGGNAYRTLYCYARGDRVWILSGFTKKTQKTPEREIDKAKAIMRRNGL